MAELRVTGLQGTQAQLALAATRIPQSLDAVMRTQLTQAVSYARARYLSGGTTVDRLAVRTGGVRAAFQSRVSRQGPIVYGRIGYFSDDAPAWVGVHEYGATIRPRRARYLAIPLTEEARRVGSPRAYPSPLFSARSRRGNLLLFRREGRAIVPVYLLRDSVTIPARPALAPTVARFAPQIAQELTAAIDRLLAGRF